MDLLASEYGWSKDHILNDIDVLEYFNLKDIIDERVIADRMMDLRISMNPHLEKGQGDLFEELDSMLKPHRERGAVAQSRNTIGEGTFDFEGMKRLKKKFNSHKVGQVVPKHLQ